MSHHWQNIISSFHLPGLTISISVVHFSDNNDYKNNDSDDRGISIEKREKVNPVTINNNNNDNEKKNTII